MLSEQPSSLVIETAYPCGHVEGGVVAIETRRDGHSVRHRVPPSFVPHASDAVWCFVCERFVSIKPC